jgi:hypothetical protein
MPISFAVPSAFKSKKEPPWYFPDGSGIELDGNENPTY